MSLLEVRKKFVRQSGRYDLVVDAPGDDWSDNGADFYIRAAHQLLDQKKTPGYRGEARLYRELAIGEYSVEFTKAFSVTGVWVSNSTGRWELAKVNREEFQAYYGAVTASIENGTPLKWTLWPLASVDSTDKPGTLIDPVSTDPEAKGIVIGPPTDEVCVVSVWGVFDSADITADGDESEWTERYPYVLVENALYLLREEYSGSRKGADEMLWEIQKSDAVTGAVGKTRILG